MMNAFKSSEESWTPRLRRARSPHAPPLPPRQRLHDQEQGQRRPQQAQGHRHELVAQEVLQPQRQREAQEQQPLCMGQSQHSQSLQHRHQQEQEQASEPLRLLQLLQLRRVASMAR